MEKNSQRYAAAILSDGHRVLLGKRAASRSDYPGIWDFIGGHCEEGETFEAALQREVFEEIGVRTSTIVLLYEVDHRPDFLLQLFLVTEWTGKVFNMQVTEHERLAWLTISEAKQLEFINHHYVAALERVENYYASLSKMI
jgi:mutator protein MutT